MRRWVGPSAAGARRGHFAHLHRKRCPALARRAARRVALEPGPALYTPGRGVGDVAARRQRHRADARVWAPWPIRGAFVSAPFSSRCFEAAFKMARNEGYRRRAPPQCVSVIGNPSECPCGIEGGEDRVAPDCVSCCGRRPQLRTTGSSRTSTSLPPVLRPAALQPSRCSARRGRAPLTPSRIRISRHGSARRQKIAGSCPKGLVCSSSRNVARDAHDLCTLESRTSLTL